MASRVRITPLILSLAVPGLGHLVAGRRGKGILFLVTILGTYGFGWGVTRGESVSFHRHPLAIAAQAGAAGPTALALIISRGRDERRWIAALVESGALGDADVERIRTLRAGGDLWKYLRREARVPEATLRQAYWASTRRAEPRLDIGVLYTMVAGLLSALVAMDAAEGRRPHPPPKET